VKDNKEYIISIFSSSEIYDENYIFKSQNLHLVENNLNMLLYLY